MVHIVLRNLRRVFLFIEKSIGRSQRQARQNPILVPVRDWWQKQYQKSLAALVGVGIIVLALVQLWQFSIGESIYSYDAPIVHEYQFRVQINHAGWAELTCLPRIGETLAKRIEQMREDQGPYHNCQDLTKVRGIGPKTAAAICPYLVFDQKEHDQKHADSQ